MTDCVNRIETMLSAIRRTGLIPRGALRLDDSERVGELADMRTIVLAGMAGRDGWDAFAASPEARDGADDPLDRWSRRVIERLARELGGKALFPFGGPPFLPFQRWAQRAESVHSSPIGLLIHPHYGLWHSYRGALGFREELAVPEPAAVPSPCVSCTGRWCLSACPVGAFSERGLRCRRLRGSPSKLSRRGLHGPGLPRAPGMPGRRGARLRTRTGEFPHARVLARAGRRLRAGAERASGETIVARIAGTMTEIATAWVLTLPATIVLSGGLFYLLS